MFCYLVPHDTSRHAHSYSSIGPGQQEDATYKFALLWAIVQCVTGQRTGASSTKITRSKQIHPHFQQSCPKLEVTVAG